MSFDSSFFILEVGSFNYVCVCCIKMKKPFILNCLEFVCKNMFWEGLEVKHLCSSVDTCSYNLCCIARKYGRENAVCGQTTVDVNV